VLFWTSLVLTGAGAAGFTITGLQVKSIEKEQTAAIQMWNPQNPKFPNDACAEARADNYAPVADICDRGDRMAMITNVLIGVTAVAAVATVYFLWKGYISPPPAKEKGVAKRRAPERNIVVAPQVNKHGGGIGAIIEF
jgi:hypothetical protein